MLHGTAWNAIYIKTKLFYFENVLLKDSQKHGHRGHTVSLKREVQGLHTIMHTSKIHIALKE